MTNISILGVVLCAILALSFLFEGSMFIRSLNKKIKGKRLIYFLGTITTLLLSIITINVTFNIVESIPRAVIILTSIFAVLFFIIAGYDSVKTERK